MSDDINGTAEEMSQAKPSSVTEKSPQITAEQLASAMARAESAERKIEDLKRSESVDAQRAAEEMAAQQMSELAAKLEAAEALAQEANDRAVRATALHNLPGLLKPDYLVHAPTINLDESGNIDQASIDALAEFRSSRPELFKMAQESRTSTPVASVGKAQSWTDNDIRQFRAVGMSPGVAQEHPLSWLVGYHGDKT